MSAFMVGEEHIDLLVTAALAWELAVAEQADEIGRMLWKENLISLRCRYPSDRDGDRPGPLSFRDDDVDTYTFMLVPGRVDPRIVQTAARCYDYQSCEHPGWPASSAKAWTGRLEARAEELLADFESRYGQLDISLQEPNPHGRFDDWYWLIDEHDTRTLKCGGAWPVDDRELFERTARLRAKSRSEELEEAP